MCDQFQTNETTHILFTLKIPQFLNTCVQVLAPDRELFARSSCKVIFHQVFYEFFCLLSPDIDENSITDSFDGARFGGSACEVRNASFDM